MLNYDVFASIMGNTFEGVYVIYVTYHQFAVKYASRELSTVNVVIATYHSVVSNYLSTISKIVILYTSEFDTIH